MRDLGTMPANCDGLELFEGLIFEKGKCGWVKKQRGRMFSRLEKIKSHIGTKSVCLTLPIEQYNLILKKANLESEEKKLPISIPMVIREALKNSFPFMEQMEMFK